jgi:hypothetical protein
MNKTNTYRQKVLIGNWVEEQFAQDHVKNQKNKAQNQTLELKANCNLNKNKQKYISEKEYELYLEKNNHEKVSKLKSLVSLPKEEQLTRIPKNPVSENSKNKCNLKKIN